MAKLKNLTQFLGRLDEADIHCGSLRIVRNKGEGIR